MSVTIYDIELGEIELPTKDDSIKDRDKMEKKIREKIRRTEND